MPRAQRIVLLVLGIAFFALAAGAYFLRGFPWYIAILWVVSGVVLILMYRRSAPRPAPPPTPADPSTRARRSGNPAVRAAQRERDDDAPTASA